MSVKLYTKCDVGVPPTSMCCAAAVCALQGFPMKQGVLTNGRVRLLMSPGDQCFRGYGRRNGENLEPHTEL